MTDYNLFSPPNLSKTRTLRKVFADVEFGVMQANGECIGVGICRIITTHQMRPRSSYQRRCPRAEAMLQASVEGRLEIFFPKRGMLPCTERAFFRQRVFPVPVPIFLPGGLRRSLPNLQQTIVEAGLYPVRSEATGYWVAF